MRWRNVVAVVSAERSTPIIPKAEAVARRAAYRAGRKDERHSHWRCFWTWPWGHVWRGDGRAGLAWFRKCAACGKTGVDVP